MGHLKARTIIQRKDAEPIYYLSNSCYLFMVKGKTYRWKYTDALAPIWSSTTWPIEQIKLGTKIPEAEAKKLFPNCFE